MLRPKVFMFSCSFLELLSVVLPWKNECHPSKKLTWEQMRKTISSLKFEWDCLIFCCLFVQMLRWFHVWNTTSIPFIVRTCLRWGCFSGSTAAYFMWSLLISGFTTCFRPKDKCTFVYLRSQLSTITWNQHKSGIIRKKMLILGETISSLVSLFIFFYRINSSSAQIY